MIYVLYGREQQRDRWEALAWSRISEDDVRDTWSGGIHVDGTGYVIRPAAMQLIVRSYDTQNPDDTLDHLPATATS